MDEEQQRQQASITKIPNTAEVQAEPAPGAAQEVTPEQMLSAIVALLTSQGAQDVLAAHAKRVSAEPDLAKLRIQLEHERAMDHQKRNFEHEESKLKVGGWLMGLWSVVIPVVVGAAVWARHEGFISTEVASIGTGLLAAAATWLTSRMLKKN